MSERKTDDATLIQALRILSRTIQTEGGVIPACLAEAATRLETLVEERRWIPVGERLPVTFVVPGKPIAQPRTSTARNGHRFTPDNGIKGYRDHVAMMARRAGCNPAPITDPVAITIRMFFARPKSHFTAKGQLKSSAPRFPPKRLGDSDNIGKGVKDCLISIAYDDDSQVVEDHYFKSWGPEDRTEITIH